MPEQAIMSPFSFDVERKGDLSLVKCHGRLVSGVCDTLYLKITKLIPDSKRIVLDLTDLTHMDSMGLGTVVRPLCLSQIGWLLPGTNQPGARRATPSSASPISCRC